MDSHLEVLVVDDDPTVRTALGRVIRSAGHEVRTFATAREFLEHGLNQDSGCLVLDMRLPDLDGLELYRRVQARGAYVPAIFLSGFGDIPTTVRAIKSGATDFLPKPVPDDALLAAISTALASEERSRSGRRQAVDATRRYSTLTPRERQVMRLVLTGRLNKQIARDLKISEKTVKVHRANVMSKMGVRRAVQLAPLAASIVDSDEVVPTPLA